MCPGSVQHRVEGDGWLYISVIISLGPRYIVTHVNTLSLDHQTELLWKIQKMCVLGDKNISCFVWCIIPVVCRAVTPASCHPDHHRDQTRDHYQWQGWAQQLIWAGVCWDCCWHATPPSWHCCCFLLCSWGQVLVVVMLLLLQVWGWRKIVLESWQTWHCGLRHPWCPAVAVVDVVVLSHDHSDNNSDYNWDNSYFMSFLVPDPLDSMHKSHLIRVLNTTRRSADQTLVSIKN